VERVQFGGWNNVARLASGSAEMLVTLDVGPRIISLRLGDGPNLMHVFPQDAGARGGDAYRFYGGHRLWIAPEEPVRTMQPDNDPVEVVEDGEEFSFVSVPDRFHIQKALTIEPLGNEAFRVTHSVENQSPYSAELALWALSMCAAGGEVLFPAPPFESHTDRVLPAGPLVRWGYTRLGDPRFTWGDRVIRLRQDSAAGPNKIGAYVDAGYAGYRNGGTVLMKRFPAEFGADYPDYGCNFETFTNQEMIEIESLGEFVDLGPNEVVVHTETWALFGGQSVPENEDALAEWLADLAARTPTP
jgi:hypothetical protein